LIEGWEIFSMALDIAGDLIFVTIPASPIIRIKIWDKIDR